MKVLWFTDSPSSASSYLNLNINIGGWIESLHQEIMKVDGIELGIAFPFGYDLEKRFKIGTTEYFSFPYPRKEKYIKGILSRWKHHIEPKSIITQYLKIVHEFKPDVIQIFGTESPYGLLIPLIKTPIVIHIQGNLTVCSYKWFLGLSFIDILRYSKVKHILQAYGLWHLYFIFSRRAIRERNIMSNCKYFIGRTDWDRRICKVLSPESKYFHCEELLRKDFYEAKCWQKPTSNAIIIISTISPMAYKGIEMLLETITLLSQHKRYIFEWNIIGMKGSEEIVAIAEKATKIKFSDVNINFKGSLTSNELISELHKANIYVHPSHIENSPNSVCEAMFLGMPVIATYAGGTPSILTNGYEGLLVQDGDPWSLAGAIFELLEDEDNMTKLAENAHRRALDRHNRESVRDRILEIYKQIVEANNN